jgi:hypothetical protein
MTLTRRIEFDDWLDERWEDIARLSILGGVSVQDTRDAAVLVDALKGGLAGHVTTRTDNVIPLPGPAVRAVT